MCATYSLNYAITNRNMESPLAKDLNHVLDHTREIFGELRGARIFITGGTGFFGKWILESLLWANERLNVDCQTTVLTRQPELFKASVPHLAGHRSVSLLQGNVRNFEFPQGTFTHIIHAATESSEKLNLHEPLVMVDTIVEGTRHTLDFARTCGAENFLLTSSGAVYGKQPSGLTHIAEEYSGGPDPLDPKAAYAEGKRMAEYLCSVYADAKLHPKIARCFAFVGPYFPLNIHFAIGNFIRDAMNGGPIIVRGDGTPHRSYLYAADLAIWLWTILLRGKAIRPYNVGSHHSVSIAELASLVASEFSPGTTVEIQGVADSKRPVDRYVPDTRRAENELGLQEIISLRDGIHKTRVWYETK